MRRTSFPGANTHSFASSLVRFIFVGTQMVGDGHSITISIGTTDDYIIGGRRAIRSGWMSLEKCAFW